MLLGDENLDQAGTPLAADASIRPVRVTRENRGRKLQGAGDLLRLRRAAASTWLANPLISSLSGMCAGISHWPP